MCKILKTDVELSVPVNENDIKTVENIDFSISDIVQDSSGHSEPLTVLRTPSGKSLLMTSTPSSSKENTSKNLTSESMLSMEIEFLNRERFELKTRIYTMEEKVNILFFEILRTIKHSLLFYTVKLCLKPL